MGWSICGAQVSSQMLRRGASVGDDIVSRNQNRKVSRRSSGRPTIADVAKLAGVAAITVSRALRDPSLVSAELRAQIDTAVVQLGYAPDPNARALASSRADVIGVLVPSLTNIVFADTVRGIYDELGESPLQILMGNTHYSPCEEERLVRMFLSQRPSALIVSGIDQTDTTRKLLETAGCPVVQIMEIGEDPVDMLVGFSHFEGGKTATNHLLEAGYRRIGFIGARMDPRSQRRLARHNYLPSSATPFRHRATRGAPRGTLRLTRQRILRVLARVQSVRRVHSRADQNTAAKSRSSAPIGPTIRTVARGNLQ